MDDNSLIDVMARVWIANGADAVGFNLLMKRICVRIRELEEVMKE